MAAPYSGHIAVVGMAATLGPVDGYLFLARATVGGRAAALPADRAEQQAAAWGLDAYRSWLAGHRERLGI